MNVAVIGANGQIGQQITRELLSRGHSVTAVIRDPSKLALSDPKLKSAAGDVTDVDSIAAAVAGHDAVVSSIGPNHAIGNSHILIDSAHNLIAGLKKAGVKRLIVVGGAGSLEVAPGVRLIDTPEFPEAWKSGAMAHVLGLDIYRAEKELEWTFFSPAAMIQPGERTGKFRLGGDQLLTDDAGNSAISIEDYSIALVDELENPAHIGKRFTIAY